MMGSISTSTCSDLEAQKLLAVLKIMQADEERKVLRLSNTKKAAEKMVLGANKRKNAESGNPTKRTSNDSDGVGSATVEPPTHVKVNFSVSDLAKELVQTLSQQSPCTFKLLQTTDMHAGFLDMSENLCEKFFPSPEGSHVVVDFILVDEANREYKMSYSFRTRRFLGKWRDFFLEHKLVSGDALVFNQTGNCKIKVYTLKPKESTEDGRSNGNSSKLDIPDNPYGSTRIVKTVKQLGVELPPIDVQAETAPKSNSNSSDSFFQKERLDLDNEIAGSTRIVKTAQPVNVELPPIDVQTYTAPNSNSNSNSNSSNSFFQEERLNLDNGIAGNGKIVKTVEPLNVDLPPIDVQTKTATPRSTSCSSNSFFPIEIRNLDNKIAGSTMINKTLKPLDVEHPPIDVEIATPRSNSSSTPPGDVSDRSSNNIGPDVNVSLHMKISSSIPNFMKVNSFEDFKICVNGEILDTKIALQHRKKYYELCKSQKMFLHERVKGFKGDVVKMIQRTIKIAEAAKSASISTSLHDLENMEKDLKALEDMGMGVGFLCKRINKLVKLLSEHKVNTESKKRKLGQIEDEQTALREELLTHEKLTKSMTTRKSSIGYFQVEIGTLEKENKNLEFMIKDVVDSAW